MASLLAFLLFAGLAVVCALVALFHRSVVHSAFALLGTLLGVADLFLQLGADYLAMTQVLIYVGGILVLILFGLMLTPPDRRELRPARIFLGLAVTGAGALLFLTRMDSGAWKAAPLQELPDLANQASPTAEPIGLAFLERDSWLLAFEFASVILLAALVGAVFIARRRFRVDDEGA